MQLMKGQQNVEGLQYLRILDGFLIRATYLHGL